MHRTLALGALAAGSLFYGLGGADRGEWASRLPVVLYAALGLAALFLLVSRLVDARAGAAAVVVCATAPLYYVGAHSLTAQATTLASSSVATAGIGLAALAPLSRGLRAGALAVGLGGLWLGWLARGPLAGVVLPAASVALTWALTEREPGGRLAALFAAGSALVASAALIAQSNLAATPLGRGLAGLALSKAAPTFDVIIANLAHAFFPWSALLPFALCALTTCPPHAPVNEGKLRVLVLSGTILAFGIETLSAHCFGPEPFAGTAFIAAAVGLWSWDVERGVAVSRSVLCSLGLTISLLALDFMRIPGKRLVAFALGASRASLGNSPLPDAPASPLFMASTGLVLVGAVIAGIGSTSRRACGQRLAPFVATLLAALLLRFGYYPRLVEPRGVDASALEAR